MPDLITKIQGHAGRMTLNRPDALNAMTYEMCLEIERQLDLWERDDAVKIVILDAVGDKAFCAGGDIAKMYETAKAGDYDYGRKFWTDEYRLNAKLATSPKPIVSFLQGYTLGGGVGIGCHVPHRIVCETSKIGMPECAIGLIPDVGGSLLLARSPGRVGEYLGITAARMSAADAIWAGFADYFIPQDQWDACISALCETGDLSAIDVYVQVAGPSDLAALQPDIDRCFGGETLSDILNALRFDGSDFAENTMAKLTASPLAMASAVEVTHRVRTLDDIVAALDMEYRFTYRAASDGEFIEGIRAMIIDKDKQPKWQHRLDDRLTLAVSRMLRPLGKDKLDLTEGAQ